MVSFNNFLISGLLAFTAAAAPLAEAATEETSPNFLLEKRKNGNKCEAHIHLDSSNGLCGAHCTDKYAISLLDNTTPGNVMGYDWNWQNLGTWYATNPDYRIKIRTTKGPELWIDGRIPSGFVTDNWRRSFTLHYGSQHWNSHECENWKYKGPRTSNGFRHEWDLWCEFDC